MAELGSTKVYGDLTVNGDVIIPGISQNVSPTYAVVINGTNVVGYTDIGVYLGTSGYSGISGYSGYSGLNGATSASGYSGTSGYSGSIGTSGYSGRSGYSGSNGSTGASGISGYSGRSGYSGSNGSIGTSGYSGRSGYSGAPTNLSGWSTYPALPTASAASLANAGRIRYSDTSNSSTVEVCVRTGAATYAWQTIFSNSW